MSRHGSACLSEPSNQPGEYLHRDICYLRLGPTAEFPVGSFLVSVDDYCNYTQAHRLLGDIKSAENIKDATDKSNAEYRSHQWERSATLYDSEAVLISCRSHEQHQGITVSYTTPGAHNKRCESNWKQIKQRTAIILGACPYDLVKAPKPIVIAAYLGAFHFSVFLRGLEPNSLSRQASPKQLVTRGPTSFSENDLFSFLQPLASKEEDGSSFHCLFMGIHPDMKSATAVMVYVPAGESLESGFYERSTRNLSKIKALATWGLVPYGSSVPPIFFEDDDISIPDDVPHSGSPLTFSGDPPNSFSIFGGASNEEPITFGDPSFLPSFPHRIVESLANPILPIDKLPSVMAEMESPVPESSVPAAKVPTLGGDIPADADDLPAYAGNLQSRPHRKAKDVNWRTRDLDLKSVLAIIPKKMVSRPLTRLQDYVGTPLQDAAEQSAVIEFDKYRKFEVARCVHFESMSPEERSGVIGATLVVRQKLNSDGSHDRMSSRLALRGDQENESNIGEIFSPTCDQMSVLTLLAIGAKLLVCTFTIDIEGAFLHAPIREGTTKKFFKLTKINALMWCKANPEDKQFLSSKFDLYLELLKYAYGLKEAPLQFFLELLQVFLNIGYKQLSSDMNVLLKYVSNDSWLIILVYVDDLGLFVNDGTTYGKDNVTDHQGPLLSELLGALHTRFGESSVKFQRMVQFLGIKIDWVPEQSAVLLSQPKYSQALEKKFDLGVPKVYHTPASDDLFALSKDTAPTDKTEYLSKLYSLFHPSRWTARCLNFPLTVLASRSSSPTNGDLQKLNRVYDWYRTHSTSQVVKLQPLDWKVSSAVDASFASHDDLRSHLSMLLFLGGTLILFRNYKDKRTSTSSTTAENAAICDASSYMQWLSNFLGELPFIPRQVDPMIIYEDNKSAITQVSEACSFKRSKHEMIRLAYVRDLVEQKVISISYIPTADQPADGGTKPKQGAAYDTHQAVLMGWTHGPGYL